MRLPNVLLQNGRPETKMRPSAIVALFDSRRLCDPSQQWVTLLRAHPKILAENTPKIAS